ncbi:MAG: hypothetical protein OHK0019_16270 [Saprospiraceae bacterium]
MFVGVVEEVGDFLAMQDAGSKAAHIKLWMCELVNSEKATQFGLIVRQGQLDGAKVTFD